MKSYKMKYYIRKLYIAGKIDIILDIDEDITQIIQKYKMIDVVKRMIFVNSFKLNETYLSMLMENDPIFFKKYVLYCEKFNSFNVKQIAYEYYCKTNDVEMVKSLLDSYKNLNKQEGFEIGCKYNNYDIVKLIFSYGNIIISYTRYHLMNDYNTKLYKFILENFCQTYGFNLILLSAYENGNLLLFKTIKYYAYKHGYNDIMFMDIFKYSGFTINKNMDIFKIIFTNKQIDLVLLFNNIFKQACKNNDIKTAKYLLSMDIKPYDMTEIFKCCLQKYYIKILKLLLSLQDQYGKIYIHTDNESIFKSFLRTPKKNKKQIDFLLSLEKTHGQIDIHKSNMYEYCIEKNYSWGMKLLVSLQETHGYLDQNMIDKCNTKYNKYFNLKTNRFRIKDRDISRYKSKKSNDECNLQ